MSLSPFSIKLFVKEYTSLINGQAKTFTARPYNRFMPDKTKWWVVPSTAWPAFGREKLIFWTENMYLYAGISIEKGISIADNDPTRPREVKNIIMDDAWSWANFMHDMRDGIVDDMVDQFNTKVNYPVHMTVSASLVNDVNSYDPFSDKLDTVEFSITRDTLQVCDSKFELMAINQLETIEGIKEIPDIIESAKGGNWLWMDVTIFAPIYCIKKNSSYDLNRIRARVKPLEERVLGKNV